MTTAQAVAVVSFRNNLAASTQALDYLSSVAEDVTEVGTETVRGTETVHYRATVDLTELGHRRSTTATQWRSGSTEMVGRGATGTTRSAQRRRSCGNSMTSGSTWI